MARSAWPATLRGRRPRTKDLRREARALKEVVAELMLENRLLKKARSGLGTTAHEIPRRRENGDRPAGRAVPAAGAPHILMTVRQPVPISSEMAIRRFTAGKHKLRRGNPMEQASEGRGGIAAHLGFECILRLPPKLARLDQEIAPRLRNGELTAPAIASHLEPNEALCQKLAHVVTQRRPVHHHRLRH